MNILMYCLIIFNFYTVTEVKGNRHECRELLAHAGCDGKGHLLSENVCLNSSYNSTEPPNYPTIVYVRFEQWPRIIDINEASSTLNIRFDDAFLLWEDFRLEINMDKLDAEKLSQLPMFKKLMVENALTKMWTPLHSGIQIEGMIIGKTSDPKNEWGIPELGIKFDVPLIVMKMPLIIKMECEFSYKGYPIDSQLCKIRFSSDRFKRLTFLLDDPLGICNNFIKAYQQNGFIVFPTCVNDTEDNPEIGLDFSLGRTITAQLLEYYIPSTMIVSVSLTSFHIPLSASPGRISLVATLFLALTNLFISEQVKFLYQSH